MHIFIDESGTFAPVTGKHSISAVGALVVPDASLTKVLHRYQLLRSALLQKGDEAKGRELDEQAVDSVIQLLVNDDILFEITVIDMGLHTEPVLEESKVRQAQAITADLTDKHARAVHEALWDIWTTMVWLRPWKITICWPIANERKCGYSSCRILFDSYHQIASGGVRRRPNLSSKRGLRHTAAGRRETETFLSRFGIK